MRSERILSRRVKWMGILCILSVSGCAQLLGIEDLPEVRDGGNPPGPDATVKPPIDANPDQSDANCNIWPFEPEHFDPCGPGRPPLGLTPLVLGINGIYTYDTDTGLLLNPADVAVVPTLIATQERGVQAIWAQGVTIESGTTLRVEGTKALMIISTADIKVSGIIDVSSSWNSATKSFDTGAGSEPSDCLFTTPQTGGDCNDGGGGGGGGGFSGGGGTGGRGGGTRDCNGEIGIPGGTGGRRLSTPQGKIRGGCAGARGGNGDATALYGLGGAGGGAVHLVAQTLIGIEGFIYAGGAAGAGAEDRRSGGGGGGSGGFIGLEAPDVEIYPGAVLAANGGGGGGGTDGGLRSSGQDGQLSDDPATGGVGHAGGNGGPGGAATSTNGQPGGDGDRGGGGGGGGGGFIVVYHEPPAIASGAIISPAYTQR